MFCWKPFHNLRNCRIDKIYQFGASFSDTGNRIVEVPSIPSSRLSYGESSFLGPTGRFSDGLLMNIGKEKLILICCVAHTHAHFVFTDTQTAGLGRQKSIPVEQFFFGLIYSYLNVGTLPISLYNFWFSLLNSIGSWFAIAQSLLKGQCKL